MQNLLLKNKLAQKTIPSLLFFTFLLFFLNLSYNQTREILASEEEEAEEEERGGLLCGKEIPNGEAMERTGELLIALMEELSIIDGKAYEEIRATEEMIEFVKQCDTGECKSHCKTEIFYGAYCIPEACSGQICPEDEINTEFEKIDQAYNLVKESKDKIIDLIDGKTESLCDKINEDIITRGEEYVCRYGSLEVTKKEVIERKLNKAREEFDKCYIPAADWIKVAKGEIAAKVLLNCETVQRQGLSHETKTTEEIRGEKIPVCTSLHNWFCCTGP